MKTTWICIFIVLAVLPILFAQKPSKQEKMQAMAHRVDSLVESQKYDIVINSATSSKGRFINLTSNYSVKISGDSIYSYLPFYGEAFTAPIGDDQGLIFDAIVTDYKAEKKKNAYEVNFKTRSKSDTFRYSMSISESGYVSVNVFPNNRSNISYRGTLNLPE